ncbi:MAG: single-stranded-DNA-specific exonuclease RecJ, partial [Eubacterium sp.]|nr:single-stranded-DNA-specific exonuclease RecJ [Eubacterium sp.]
MAHRKWVLREADKNRANDLSEKFNIDPFIAFLLVARGIDSDIAFSEFVSESVKLVSPFDFTDMEKAVQTVKNAIRNNEKICIFGDYDCDGVTSTAIMLSFLKKEGAKVFHYIPNREGEGYGLNFNAIDEIKSKNASLIITVDNGINAIEEAQYIYSLGMKLLVTDHHQVGSELPRAEAVINPHRAENNLDFRDYCGAGVAFKLICAVSDEDAGKLVDEYIDLVAIGTIGDVVPLTNENRVFVREGLKKINFNPRSAVKAFKAVNSSDKVYTANDIAFQLCPKINAVGRMSHANTALEFLLSENYNECCEYFNKLISENSNRQAEEKAILSDIAKKIEQDESLVNKRVIVISGEGYHHGVVGIVASHIVEKYAKPTIIIGIDENNVARGSARSVEGFNIFEAIGACSEDIIQFGGHPLAAGVTLEKEKIELFTKHINEYAFSNFEIMPPLKLTVDCKLSPFYLSIDFVDNLKILEPYGASNPQAVFAIERMKLINVSPMSEGKHIKLELEKKGRIIKVVKFSSPYDEFPFCRGDYLDLALKITDNYFNSRRYLSVQAL